MAVWDCLTPRRYGVPMNSLPAIFQLVAVAVMLFGFVMVMNAPEILGHWAQGKRDEAERGLLQQAEIERKLAIAEAANAARARGERFVPPADYDR